MWLILGVILVVLAFVVLLLAIGGSIAVAGLALIQGGGLFSIVFGIILLIIGIKIIINVLF